MTRFAATGTGDASLKPMADMTGRLGFAATPTFALMAGVSAASAPGMSMCSVASPLVPINDMALMYLLMSVFHLSPWLHLLSQRFAAPITQTEGD
ncbi:hypothetical protein GTW25_07540 [Aliihoeflea aestuarii]|jgi:hypothetical protein|uniref:hypothetical protein n=1 Tax=Aliihoeflea aestuarii TaxID=453840 RepID=UPI0020931ECD|nr:hypothetical protein [Aliihoeflea aestuarii]MCO6390880.1 hypothetical protein [Aliihoeflea aestuarii]